MHLFSRQLSTHTVSTLSEGTLFGWTPIGRLRASTTTARCQSATFTSLQNLRVPRAKSWIGRHPNTHIYNPSGICFLTSWHGTTTRRHASLPKQSNAAGALMILFGASALAIVGQSFVYRNHDQKNNVEAEGPLEIGEIPSSTSTIRLAELPRHGSDTSSKWVVQGTSVYDISDFVEQHPGGEVILRACGGSIDPYWNIFSIHQKSEVFDVLKQYYVGKIDERDLDSNGHINWTLLGTDCGMDDPFKDDPERDPHLIVRTAKPCNAETPSNLLTEFLTPVRLFFVRNHLWVPRIQESDHSLSVELSDGDDKTFSLTDLQDRFKQHTITATLQCAGNRRSHMSQASAGKTAGLQWDVGAIGTAEFTGVRLRDVLREAGWDVEVDCSAPCMCSNDTQVKHVHLASPNDTYAASIPLQTALSTHADVLLAWSMNGEPISRDHGGPLRAIVPGTTAARSVKWVGRVCISSEEASSQWQQRDYKCFGPNRRAADVSAEDWDEAQAIQEMPVQSAITTIAKVGTGVNIRGWAFSGGGRGIVRVDVSGDGGRTWRQARLQPPVAKGSKRWAWTFWDIDWPAINSNATGDECEFVVKAVDDAYNTQPERFDSIWNFRGLLANAWHRVGCDIELSNELWAVKHERDVRTAEHIDTA